MKPTIRSIAGIGPIFFHRVLSSSPTELILSVFDRSRFWVNSILLMNILNMFQMKIYIYGTLMLNVAHPQEYTHLDKNKFYGSGTRKFE